MSVDELAGQAATVGLQGEIQLSVAEAMARAKEIAEEGDMIFVGGSNFVVAEIL
jgi:dihydrofolate synthase/folylpolyglutamate synthase